MATRLPRLTALILTMAMLEAVASCEVLAQAAYPNRPIRMVVAAAAGGGGDRVGRLLAQGLSERLGRQVVVENRPGAGGIIAYETVARSPADGYTLLLCAPTLAINPATHKKVPYDAMRDFAPITQAVSSPILVMAHPSVPVKTVKGLIAFAKARPSQVLYASAGYGTLPHLALEMFSMMAQIRMTHVPYKGATPGVVDLVAGHVAVSAAAIIASLPLARAGKVRALGVTSASRVAVAPDIPTIAESGLPGYETVVWYGLLAPSGTSRDIIVRLHKESVSVLRSQENKDRIATDGAEAVANTPAEFTAFINSEIVKWAKVAKAVGIKPQ